MAASTSTQTSAIPEWRRICQAVLTNNNIETLFKREESKAGMTPLSSLAALGDKEDLELLVQIIKKFPESENTFYAEIISGFNKINFSNLEKLMATLANQPANLKNMIGFLFRENNIKLIIQCLSSLPNSHTALRNEIAVVVFAGINSQKTHMGAWSLPVFQIIKENPLLRTKIINSLIFFYIDSKTFASSIPTLFSSLNDDNERYYLFMTLWNLLDKKDKRIATVRSDVSQFLLAILQNPTTSPGVIKYIFKNYDIDKIKQSLIEELSKIAEEVKETKEVKEIKETKEEKQLSSSALNHCKGKLAAVLEAYSLKPEEFFHLLGDDHPQILWELKQHNDTEIEFHIDRNFIAHTVRIMERLNAHHSGLTATIVNIKHMLAGSGSGVIRCNLIEFEKVLMNLYSAYRIENFLKYHPFKYENFVERMESYFKPLGIHIGPVDAFEETLCAMARAHFAKRGMTCDTLVTTTSSIEPDAKENVLSISLSCPLQVVTKYLVPYLNDIAKNSVINVELAGTGCLLRVYVAAFMTPRFLHDLKDTLAILPLKTINDYRQKSVSGARDITKEDLYNTLATLRLPEARVSLVVDDLVSGVLSYNGRLTTITDNPKTLYNLGIQLMGVLDSERFFVSMLCAMTSSYVNRRNIAISTSLLENAPMPLALLNIMAAYEDAPEFKSSKTGVVSNMSFDCSSFVTPSEKDEVELSCPMFDKRYTCSVREANYLIDYLNSLQPGCATLKDSKEEAKTGLNLAPNPFSKATLQLAIIPSVFEHPQFFKDFQEAVLSSPALLRHHYFDNFREISEHAKGCLTAIDVLLTHFDHQSELGMTLKLLRPRIFLRNFDETAGVLIRDYLLHMEMNPPSRSGLSLQFNTLTKNLERLHHFYHHIYKPEQSLSESLWWAQPRSRPSRIVSRIPDSDPFADLIFAHPYEEKGTGAVSSSSLFASTPPSGGASSLPSLNSTQ